MNEEVLKVRIEVDDNNAEAKIDRLKDNFDGISNNAKLSEKETKSLNKALASIKSAKVSELTTKFKDLKEVVKSSKAAVTALAAAISIATYKAIVKLSLKVSDLGDQVDKASQKAGMAKDTYQTWTYIFDRCGLSADDLNTTMRMLQKNTANVVAQGKYAGSAFQKLGISEKELSKLKTDELFARTVTQLQKLSDETQRTSIAFEIFGRNATALNPLLNSTNADIEKLIRTQNILGGQMSNNLVNLSAKMNDTITDLKYAMQGLRNTIAESFLPSIQAVTKGLAKAIAYISMFLRAVFGLKSATNSTSVKATGGMNSYTNAVNKATKATEKLKRTTMGFDELNIVNNPNKAAANDNYDLGLDDIDFGGLDSLNESIFSDEELAKMEKFKEKMDSISEKMRYITPIALTLGGALMIVVGLATFNIPMIIGGAAICGLGIAIGKGNGSWDDMTAKLEKNAKKIKDITFSASMIVLLLVSLVTGNIPLAIACGAGLIAGIVGLGQDYGWWEKIGDGLKKFWDGMKTWFNNNVKVVFTRQYWRQKWDNIVLGFKDGINGLMQKIESGMNNIVNKFNNSGVITAMNRMFNWNINIKPISIPRLATGGIIDKPTLSMIGESGKEAVVPLENNTEWIDKLASRLTTNTPTKLVLAVDGKELGWCMINNINGITKQTGSLQLKLV